MDSEAVDNTVEDSIQEAGVIEAMVKLKEVALEEAMVVTPTVTEVIKIDNMVDFPTKVAFLIMKVQDPSVEIRRTRDSEEISD